MPHLHTQPGDHDVTASAYIMLLSGPEPRIILHQHKKLHKLLQFGGHVEHNENPWQAIAHELAEESGYQMNQLNILQPPDRIKEIDGGTIHPTPLSLQTHPFGDLNHYHIDIAYAFTTNEQPLGHIMEGESATITAYTQAELIAIPAEDIIENVRQTALFVFRTALPKWQSVPAKSFSLDT